MEKHMALAAILAAGEAARAGGPKLVWEVEGLPSVRRVVLAALGAEMVSEVLVVTGRWEAEVRGALAGLAPRFVHNPDFAEGQSSSVRKAVAQAGAANEAIFLLADQPFVSSQMLSDLVNFHRRSPGSITRPVRGGRHLNPAIFDLGLWRGALSALRGDQGGRSIIRENPAEVNLWPAENVEARAFWDFDTEEDYERLKTRG